MSLQLMILKSIFGIHFSIRVFYRQKKGRYSRSGLFHGLYLANYTAGLRRIQPSNPKPEPNNHTAAGTGTTKAERSPFN